MAGVAHTKGHPATFPSFLSIRWEVTRADGAKIKFYAPTRRAAIRYARGCFGYRSTKTLTRIGGMDW